MLKFTKMNGAGNDFVLLDNLDGSLRLASNQIASLCDRHRGDWGGQRAHCRAGPPMERTFACVIITPTEAKPKCAEMERAAFARLPGSPGGQGPVSFETPAGIIRAECAGTNVRLAMSEPRDLALDRQFRLPRRKRHSPLVNTGVPHAVVFVDDLEIDVRRLGANCGFIRISPRRGRMRFLSSSSSPAPSQCAPMSAASKTNAGLRHRRGGHGTHPA